MTGDPRADLRSLAARSQGAFDPRDRPIASGTAANRPAANMIRPGSFYYETDTSTLWYSDGSTWQLTPRTMAARAYRSGSNQSVTQNVWTKVQLNAESHDAFSVFDSVTNYRLTPTRAGFFQVNSIVTLVNFSGSKGQLAIRLNGADHALSDHPVIGGNAVIQISDLVYVNGISDYIEMFVFHDDTNAADVLASSSLSFMSAAWIGA